MNIFGKILSGEYKEMTVDFMNTKKQKIKCERPAINSKGFCFGTGCCIACGIDFEVEK